MTLRKKGTSKRPRPVDHPSALNTTPSIPLLHAWYIRARTMAGYVSTLGIFWLRRSLIAAVASRHTRKIVDSRFKLKDPYL
jgi:hypothetical protein